LQVCRERNAAQNLTGILLYQHGKILQVLEGEEQDLEDVKSSIFNDNRHYNIYEIIDKPIQQRDFGNWAMAFNANVSARLLSLPGVDLFMIDPVKRPDGLDVESDLLDLLRSFKDDLQKVSA